MLHIGLILVPGFLIIESPSLFLHTPTLIRSQNHHLDQKSERCREAERELETVRERARESPREPERARERARMALWIFCLFHVIVTKT